MPAKQLRCDVWLIPEGDRTGENAIECGFIALACAECGNSAGCVEHELMCPQCRRAVRLLRLRAQLCKQEDPCRRRQEDSRRVKHGATKPQ